MTKTHTERYENGRRTGKSYCGRAMEERQRGAWNRETETCEACAAVARRAAEKATRKVSQHA